MGKKYWYIIGVILILAVAVLSYSMFNSETVGLKTLSINKPIKETFLETRDYSGSWMKIYGSGENYRSGSGLAMGDFNNDGFSDVAIGTGVAYKNQVAVFLGAENYNPAPGGYLTTDADFLITLPATQNNWLGFSLAAGDFNGDNKDDLLIGEIHADPHGASSGKVYVFYGRDSYQNQYDLSTLGVPNDQVGLVLGPSAGAKLGFDLAAGDVNGDGIDDLILGAHGVNSQTGAVYVVHGSGNSINVDLAVSSADFTITGESTNSQTGYSLATGDFNWDGVDDILIGAPMFQNNAGKSYVVYGRINQAGSISLLSDANIYIESPLGTSFKNGYSVAAGDINGDGFDDLIIGLPYWVNPIRLGDGHGAVFVINGWARNPEIEPFVRNWDSADVKLDGYLNRKYLGTQVASGDINGDGFDDIIIEAPGGSAGGIPHLYYTFGFNTPDDINRALTDIEGELVGDGLVNNWDNLEVGDFDGDGTDEIVWGIESADSNNFYNNGAVYIYKNSP